MSLECWKYHKVHPLVFLSYSQIVNESRSQIFSAPIFHYVPTPILHYASNSFINNVIFPKFSSSFKDLEKNFIPWTEIFSWVSGVWIFCFFVLAVVYRTQIFLFGWTSARLAPFLKLHSGSVLFCTLKNCCILPSFSMPLELLRAVLNVSINLSDWPLYLGWYGEVVICSIAKDLQKVLKPFPVNCVITDNRFENTKTSEILLMKT